uniref:beta-N-acetylhexosaminidase n=1 Tax=uncultured bacterium Contig99 TaxID=1393639 RepID=W0FN71_9BACT|nr:beta-N-acetylhexosaminidase [uncultured bacterium Contig99]
MFDRLVPRVNGKTQWTGETVRLPRAVSVTGAFAPRCAEAFLRRTGRADETGGFPLRVERDAALAEEGYRLRVAPDGVTAQAADERGAVWALTTLACLLDGDAISVCAIEDRPRFGHRGLSLDCARHFFPAAEVEKIIEQLALAKMNTLHWHLSDDQGWRVESRRFPALHETSGAYYTQEEIRAVVEFARVRGVEIVPEIDLPGHVSAILAADPQYSCSGKPVELARTGGIYPIIFCAGREETYAFLEELLDEVASLFPGDRFHIGGDEAPKAEWKKCPYCQARMREMGLADEEELQGYFSARVAEILRVRGKRAVCWNETLLAANRPRDLEIQYWTPMHRESMRHYIERGGRWIDSDMLDLYFDYPYSMSPVRKVYEAVPRVAGEDRSAAPGLLGMECALWSEHIPDARRLEERLFPRVQAMAENAWSGPGDYADFTARLERYLQGPLHADIITTPRDWWDPEGSARQAEAFGYLRTMTESLPAEVREQTLQAAAPDPEFERMFATRFFRPEDIPILKRLMQKQ